MPNRSNYNPQICILCYTGFVHPFWVVRNASFLLFAELVNYILGHLNTEFQCGYRFHLNFQAFVFSLTYKLHEICESFFPFPLQVHLVLWYDRSNLSIGELKQHYGGIYNQVLKNLKEHSTGTKTCPTIFLSLMISSKLYPDISDKDNILGEYLFSLLSSPIYKIRSVAARTLVLVSSRDAIKQFVQKSIQELDTSSQNKINGILMFVLEAAKCDNSVLECDMVEKASEKLNIDGMLDVNISLVLQIYLTLFKRGISCDIITQKVVEMYSSYKPKGYPANVLDYLGLWCIANKDYEAVYAHIKCHCRELTDIFWKKLNIDFYRTLSLDKLIWLLDALTNNTYSYVHEYLADSVFIVINEHFKSNLTIPSYILNFLSDNAERYAYINMALAVSYNISTNDPYLRLILQNNLRFDSSNTKLLSYMYKIQSCTYNHVLSSELLASALLHSQSENEDIRQLATRFCVLISTGRGSVNVTAIHAMECVVKYVRNLADVENQGVYISAIKGVRERVLANKDEGFDIHSNAHFDKELFLRLVNF